MSTTYDDLTEEVRGILIEESRPLSTRDIAARSDLADGVASLSTPLRRLREAGEVIAVDDGGPRLYRLADESDSQPPADQAAGYGPASVIVRDPQTKDLRACVREAAALMPGEFTSGELASACGLETKPVSKALWELAEKGELERRKIAGNRYAYFLPGRGSNEPPVKGRSDRVREAIEQMDGEFTPADIIALCGEDAGYVRKTLWRLSRTGELEVRREAGNRYAYRRPGAGGKQKIPTEAIAPRGAIDAPRVSERLSEMPKDSALLYGRVREAIEQMEGEFTDKDIGVVTGDDPSLVRSALLGLAHRGEVGCRALGGGFFAYFRPRLVAGQQTPAAAAEPRPAEKDAGQDGRDALHRYAYRSDGTLVIEPLTGEPSVELDREDTERLYRYLTAIHRGVQAALKEEA